MWTQPAITKVEHVCNLLLVTPTELIMLFQAQSMMCQKESPYKNVSANKREDWDDFPDADGVPDAPDATLLST